MNMKLLIIAITFISFQAQARVMSFGHVTPFTEQNYEIKVKIISSKINDKLFSFQLTNLPEGKDVFLIRTKKHRAAYEQKFREEIWEINIEENRKARVNTGYKKHENNPIIAFVKLKPQTHDKYGVATYSVDISQEDMKSTYIYIDYVSQMWGGGNYYSIDLKEYIPDS